VVAETQDQYRAKHVETERMRRELSLKNYHIAALNERFIRIEERIGELAARLPAGPVAALGAMPPPLDRTAQPTAPQIPLDAMSKSYEDWTRLVEEWNARLDQRFGQLDLLQANLRAGAEAGEAAPHAGDEQDGEQNAMQRR
jgi:hypothetical protein